MDKILECYPRESGRAQGRRKNGCRFANRGSRPPRRVQGFSQAGGIALVFSLRRGPLSVKLCSGWSARGTRKWMAIVASRRPSVSVWNHDVVLPPTRDNRAHHRPPTRRTDHTQSVLCSLQIMGSTYPVPPLAHITFDRKSHIELWTKVFPNPPDSLTHQIRSPSIRYISAVTTANTGWLRAFRNVVHLELCDLNWAPVSSAPFLLILNHVEKPFAGFPVSPDAQCPSSSCLSSPLTMAPNG